MTAAEERLNETMLRLIGEHDLSSNDIADVIAEQVTTAKISDNEKVSYVANRLERKFGSKKQIRGITVNYNAKADSFGGCFLSLLLSVSSQGDGDLIATGLETLEIAYETLNAIDLAMHSSQQSKEYVNWYEGLGIVLSNKVQDEMYESGLAMKDAVDLLSRRHDRESILSAIEKYKIAMKKGAFVEFKFIEKNISNIKAAHIISAFYLLTLGQANNQGPLGFTQQEIASIHGATLVLGVGAPQEEAANISSLDTDKVELIVKWVQYHSPKQRGFLI